MKMKKTALAFFYSAVILIFAMGQSVFAQALDLTKLPELKSFGMSQADFQAKSKEFSDIPGGDNFMAYSVMLPQGWSKPEGSVQKIDVTNDIISDIGHFYGPPQIDARSFFVVQATGLSYQITAKNWFLNYILTHGYTLQGFKSITPTIVEAMYTVFQDNASYVVRVKVQLNGSRIILAMYYCPEEHWKDEQAIQELAVDSFNLKNLQKTMVEKTRTYSFLDLLWFDYPESWRLQAPNILSVESMGAKVINSTTEGTLNGQINVNVISTGLDTTLPEEIKKIQKKLDEKGLQTGKLIEQPNEFTLQPQVYYSRFEVYQANDKNKELVDYEYWIGVMIENRYYYIVTMLTPARTSDFQTWARNCEAYRVVVESLRLK